MTDTLVAALWIAWLIGWLIGARWSAPERTRQSGASRLAHGLFIWMGSALIFPRVGSLLLFQEAAALAWTGIALVVAGLLITVWSRIELGRFWSAVAALKSEHALIRSGPYAITRHPIYSGLLLALAGTVLVRDTVAALAGFGLMVVGFLVKIRQEEHLLSSHFGAAFDAYRREVPALIPWPRGRS